MTESVSVLHGESCDKRVDQEGGRRVRMTGALSGRQERLDVETEVMT